jgi:hypothetical protein
MHADPMTYRRLYDQLRAYEGDSLFAEVLCPWTAANDAERRWLNAMARRPGAPIPPLRVEESWGG